MFLDIPIVLSRLLIVLCISMVVTALIGASVQESYHAAALLTIAAALGFLALLSNLTFPKKGRALNIQTAVFYLLSIVIIFPIFSALPFVFANLKISFGNALFESISALTTTGFTIFNDPSELPKTLIVWRGMLQWLGGYFTILTVSAIVVQLTLRQLPIVSSHSEMREDFTLYQRILVTARVISPFYIAATLFCFLMIALSGVSVFEAFCLSLSTISTGGFLPASSDSLLRQAPLLPYVLIPFMVIGATNFMIHIQAVTGRMGNYWKDQETILFFSLVLVLTLFVIFVTFETISGLGQTFFDGLFAAVSLMSTTGYAIGNEDLYISLPLPLVLGPMLVGGSVLSTAGGIKVIRLIILASHSLAELSKLTHPHRVTMIKSGSQVIDSDLVAGVWITFVLTLSTIALASFWLATSGISFQTSLTLAVTAISNCGAIFPHLSTELLSMVDQSATFKATLAITMIIGRIDILLLLPLLEKRFWTH